MTATSACINAGDATNTSAYSVDYAGNPRITGPAIDIGAYEYTSVIHGAATPVIQMENDIDVYPNPASNVLFVSLPGATGSIMIMDAAGKELVVKKVAGKVTYFDLKDFAAGIYVVAWQDDNHIKNTRKIVVE